jgi:hypothetical protein
MRPTSHLNSRNHSKSDIPALVRGFSKSLFIRHGKVERKSTKMEVISRLTLALNSKTPMLQTLP